MKITFEQNFYDFKILFDGVIHIFVKKEYFSSLSAGISQGEQYICFNSKDGSMMELTYEDEDVWKSILKLLKDNL